MLPGVGVVFVLRESTFVTGEAAPPAVYKERRQAPSLRPFTNFIAWFNCFEWDASHGGGGWPPLIDNPLSSRHNQGETISKKFTFSVYPLLLLFDHRHHVCEMDHGHNFWAQGLGRCWEKLAHKFAARMMHSACAADEIRWKFFHLLGRISTFMHTN